MRTIKLPVAHKDKSECFLEWTYKCQVLSRGNGWILVKDWV